MFGASLPGEATQPALLACLPPWHCLSFLLGSLCYLWAVSGSQGEVVDCVELEVPPFLELCLVSAGGCLSFLS